MACIKSAQRAALTALAPEAPYLAAGTMSGAVDKHFSALANIEIFSLDFQSDSPDLQVLAEAPSPDRFNRLCWSRPGAVKGDSFSLGLLAGGLSDGTVAVWNPLSMISSEGKAEDAMVARLEKHDGAVTGLEFSELTPNRLASGAKEGDVRIWDLKNPSEPEVFPPLENVGLSTQAEITCLTWNPRFKHILASANSNGSIVVWDLRVQKPLTSFSDSSRRNCSVLRWNPNPDKSTQLIVASDDDNSPSLRVWDVRKTTEPVQELMGHSKGVIAMSWCPYDSELLLSCGKDNRTVCWNTVSGKIITELPTSSKGNFDIHWHCKIPGVVAASAFDGKISIHNLKFSGLHAAGDSAVGPSELVGRYIYNASVDSYALKPTGTAEKHTFIIPGDLYRQLLEHQRVGIEWLWGIHCQYRGGIVADDMGLGKTFQAAVFLSGLLSCNIVSKVIIIVPLSVLHQWPDELKLAGIENCIYTYHNCDDTGLQTVLKSKGILLTSYETYGRNCQKLMGSPRWDYVILDEAHRIKNIDTKMTGLVNTIRSKKKILLTGTPIQKDIMDLYSLMNFINPGILGDLATFHKMFVLPIKNGKYAGASETQKSEYRKAVEEIRTLTSSYVLRRDKKVLTRSGLLPCKKHDMVVWLMLTKLQANLYRKLEKICEDRGHKRNLAILKAPIWQAVCNSPAAVLNIHGDKGEEKTILQSLKTELVGSVEGQTLSDKVNSCKMSFIFDLVNEIFEEEKEEKKEEDKKKINKDKEIKKNIRKILIFSRSLNMLDLIQESLLQIVEDDDIARIDGSVKKERRLELIKLFKTKDRPKILLLSAKVGGEGLNLTEATRVIIVDPSWNSSDDDQIADRVYRMGQEKDVYIYRLVTCRTIEEHTYQTQLLKGALGRAITEGMMGSSSVHKKEGKVLSLPDRKVEFTSSQTFQLLRTTKANELDFDGRHLKFLTNHELVHGVTNQNFVLSKDEKSLSDYPYERRPSSPSSPRGSEYQLSSTKLNKEAASKQHDLSTTTITSCIVIPQKKVGLLIGSNWTKIREIRLSTSTDIFIELPKCYPRPAQQLVTIKGTSERVQKAKKIIADLISEAADKQYMPVPSYMVGKVIGTGGQTVKDLMKKSGAHIQYEELKEGFRLDGNEKQVELARELISNIIDNPRREGSGQPQHGGHKPTSTSQYMPVPSDMVGKVIGTGGRTLKDLMKKSGARIQYEELKEGFRLDGNEKQVELARELISNITDKPRREGSGQPQHGGHKPTSTSGAIAGARKDIPYSRSEYYGERGPRNEKSDYAPPRNR